jgi:hypothetical protein
VSVAEHDLIDEQDAIEWRQGLRRCFQVDLRALATLRIAIALITLWDLGSRSLTIPTYLTDAGLAPRYLFWGTKWQSVYFLAGNSTGVAVLFVVHALFALMLLVGYRTRLATALCLAMSWSLIARNPRMAHGGDGLMIWMLIWSLFLPLGAVASVDSRTVARAAARTVARRPPNPLLTFATVALLLQVVVVYFGATMAKVNRHWFLDLDAVYYFLLCNRATPLGNLLAKAGALTAVLTVGSLLLESIGPWVALLSGPWPRVRTIVALMFIGLHLGFAATLYVGTFAWVCMVAWVPFIPHEVWEALAPRARRSWPARAGAAVLDGIAKLVDRPGVPGLAVRRIATGDSIVTRVLILLMGLYLVPVVITGNLPSFAAHYFAPVARLPKFKQAWSLMSVVWEHYFSLAAVATLEDGSKVTLLEGGRPTFGTRDLFWPPENAREHAFNDGTLMAAAEGDPGLAIVRCQRLQEAWDASHPPGKRVRSISIYTKYSRTTPMDYELLKPEEGMTLTYTWSRNGAGTRATGERAGHETR